MSYKHGVYGENVPYSGLSADVSKGTIPVYIGNSPIQQINKLGSASFDYSSVINTPVLINNYYDAVEKIGFSKNFQLYNLCEAVSAHFLSNDNPIGPIIVINMANPKTILETTKTTVEVPLVGAVGDKIGYIDDPQAAIENITISSTTAITASDYKLSYDGEKIKVQIKKDAFADAVCSASYKKASVGDDKITPAIFETAISSINLCESMFGIIPNILASPGYSAKPLYHEKMIAFANNKVGRKWHLICVSDIPCDSSVNTKEKAVAWKNTNGYINKLDKVFWLKGKSGDYVFNLSTLAVTVMQNLDTANNGVPCDSPSNKPIGVTKTVLSDGTQFYLDELDANYLNENGITTTNIVKGSIRLWGNSMANYTYATSNSIFPEDKQDSSIRMKLYLLNTLQYNFIDEIDKPFSKRDVDSIKVSVQKWLNSLISEGKLVYGNIDFVGNNNSLGDIVNGDFVFNVSYTSAPCAKSITFKLQYSAEGLTQLFKGEGEV